MGLPRPRFEGVHLLSRGLAGWPGSGNGPGVTALDGAKWNVATWTGAAITKGREQGHSSPTCTYYGGACVADPRADQAPRLVGEAGLMPQNGPKSVGSDTGRLRGWQGVTVTGGGPTVHGPLWTTTFLAIDVAASERYTTLNTGV